MSQILFDYGLMIIELFGQAYKKYFLGEKLNKRCAWLTLICNDEFLPGILALARSLKRSNTIYPLVVMITEDNVSKDVQQQIIDEGCSIKRIQGLYTKQQLSSMVFKRFVYVWTKLRAFEMTDVADKCVFLDADVIVLQNMDELFRLDNDPDFAAVQTCICNPAKTPAYPEYWNPSNCPLTKNVSNIDERAHMFNSGVFVFHPSKIVFQQMLEYLDEWDLNQFIFPDQHFLNKVYEKKWKRLPSIYNSLKTYSITHPDLWDVSKIKVIHYILAKPWDKSDENNQPYENINKLWWEAFQFKSDRF